jgi:hypothetical protein
MPAGTSYVPWTIEAAPIAGNWRWRSFGNGFDRGN